VETSCDRGVDADREIVIDDVARYRVAFFVPVIVPVAGVVVVGVGRSRFAAAAAAADSYTAVAVGDSR